MDSHENREEKLFQECMDLPPDKWEPFLASKCPDDPSLRETVLRLLRTMEKSEGFMDSDSLVEKEQVEIAAELQRIAPSEESPGDQIGRYRLMELIGEGAWGSVWMAQQTEDIERRVALKILKLGLDTKDFLARFEAERQVVAMMDHPNIAQVFDAGATDYGRPYFVMELIHGLPLLKYANEARLGIRERVELFIQVCQAAQHAHQKGIIHRDLKPSNILVAEHDDKPLPKVIDFGIAKTTQFHLTDKTLYTQAHTFLGTPVYSSPEQLDFSGREIDHRSDIYSLGALLYELLCGQPLFDSEQLAQLSLEEMRTILREKDPPRPSVRFANLSSEEKEKIAQARNDRPSKLETNLQGDLDWIVMKCLEKDRSRRYDSAHALIEDLHCFLEHRPVSAAAPSISYRIEKFFRRNRQKISVWTLAPAALLCLLALVFFLQSKRSAPEYPIDENDRSIAVLPLRNLSPDPDNAYVAGGVHEDILTHLSRIQSLKVIQRTSMMRYADTDKSMREIGTELGVRYLLQGSVRKAENRIKVTVQLLDAANGNHIWSNNYDRTQEDLFTIQTAIAQEVVGELVGAIGPDEQSLLEKAPTENLIAYENYSKARELEIQFGYRARLEQIEFLEKAVEEDSFFVEAWAALARAALALASGQGSRDKFHHALQVAQTLDPDHPSVMHENLFYLVAVENELEIAHQACRRELERWPQDPKLNLLYAVLLDAMNREEEGLVYHKKHVELDPFSFRSNNYISSSYYHYHGDLDNALIHLERMREGWGHIEKFNYHLWEFYRTKDIHVIAEMETQFDDHFWITTAQGLQVKFGLIRDLPREVGLYNEQKLETINAYRPFMHFLDGKPELAKKTALEILQALGIERDEVTWDSLQEIPIDQKADSILKCKRANDR